MVAVNVTQMSVVTTGPKTTSASYLMGVSLTVGNRATFDLDLQYGQDAEGRLLKILEMDGEQVEVKSDRRAPETGNIFVEYASRGKDSGIRTTTAAFWAYELGQGTDIWVTIPTARLRSKVEEILAERGHV